MKHGRKPKGRLTHPSARGNGKAGPRVLGGARHRSYLISVEHGTPLLVRRNRHMPTVGRFVRRRRTPAREQDGPRSQWRQSERQRESRIARRSDDRLDCVRDVTYAEDHSKSAPAAAPKVTATPHNTAINIRCLDGRHNIAKALRYNAGSPRRPYQLLLTLMKT